MSNEPMGGMSPEEWFVLGGIDESEGTPDGDVLDIDADPNAEAGERTRVIKPYRWWTGALIIAGAAAVAAAAFQVWATGLADFGGNETLSAAVPVSAVAYSDGLVEVQMHSFPIRKCPGGLAGDCVPNQVQARWFDGGATLAVGAWFTSPQSQGLPEAPVCGETGPVDRSNGTFVVKSPTGAAPTKVISALDGAPVDLIISRTPSEVPPSVQIGPPGLCNSSVFR